MRITAAVLLAAQVAVVAQAGQGSGGCGCGATCSILGDPHVKAFDGSQTVITSDKFTVYSAEGFDVTATVMSKNHYVSTLQFGPHQKFTAASCNQVGHVLATTSHTFKDKTTLKMKVECWKGRTRGVTDPNPPANAPFYLNTYLTKNDDNGNGSFMSVEQQLGAKGACVKLTPTTGSCKCVASCRAYGDPHIVAFDGKTKKVTQRSISIYDTKGLSISGQVVDTYLRQLTINGKTQLANKVCKTNLHKSVHHYKMKNNDSAELEITCRNTAHSNPKLARPWYFEIKLTKTDSSKAGAGSTFAAMEKSEGSSGLCITL